MQLGGIREQNFIFKKPLAGKVWFDPIRTPIARGSPFRTIDPSLLPPPSAYLAGREPRSPTDDDAPTSAADIADSIISIRAEAIGKRVREEIIEVHSSESEENERRRIHASAVDQDEVDQDDQPSPRYLDGKRRRYYCNVWIQW